MSVKPEASADGAAPQIPHRLRLFWALTLRDVIGRYRGSLLGLGWSFFNPLLMLAVYTTVFAGVFKARWGVGASEGPADFAINLFVGLTLHGFIAECVNKSPTLLLGQVSYVKKIVFPLEVLPLVALGSALFHAAIGLAILCFACLFLYGGLPVTAVLVPVILVPVIFATAGAAWCLASLGVFLRDTAQVTGVLMTLLMFLSPVFYPLAAAPPILQAWLAFNPLTYPIEWMRGALLHGQAPSLLGLAVSYVIGSLAALFGYWWFQKTRKGFADVL